MNKLKKHIIMYLVFSSFRDSLEMLIIDEADLLFSFGYEEDVKTLLGYLPKIYQAFLMSATLTDEVKDLKKLVLHNPVSLILLYLLVVCIILLNP